MSNYKLSSHMNIILFIEENGKPKTVSDESTVTAIHQYVGIRDGNDIYVVKPSRQGLVSASEVLVTSIFFCQHTAPHTLANFHPSVFHTKPGESLRESKQLKFLKLHELSEDLLERLEIAVITYNEFWCT